MEFNNEETKILKRILLEYWEIKGYNNFLKYKGPLNLEELEDNYNLLKKILDK